MSGSSDLDRSVEKLRARVEHLLARQASSPGQRLLVALAGAPGSGKTTITTALMRDLSKRGIDGVVVVPMDGFHHTKATLSTFSNPALAFRKRGAPWTFDAAGLLSLIEALKATPIADPGSQQLPIAAPSFDHAVQDPVQDDIQIPSTSKIVIVEGNYTLLDENPWSSISDMVDERWFIDAPSLEVAKERLILRHLAAGIETSREAASLRVEDNDLPNGRLVKTRLVKPDVVVVN